MYGLRTIWPIVLEGGGKLQIHVSYHTATVDSVLTYMVVCVVTGKLWKTSNFENRCTGPIVAILDPYVVTILNYYRLSVTSSQSVADNREFEV